ncbi:lipopolysaccharide assembly protein LapB [Mucilaginibacter sp. MD40]|uniref:tetratricopeptide repeat protein n=1 Tax=Mucilaginibacter sp. MD40 TaxID=2029590 RepID=UPI0011806069|nr:hypothetical protein [Mucilaginibacter sp. MD40]
MMNKLRLLLLTGILFSFCRASAQSADEVYNQYLDFNLARLQGETDKALSLGEDLLPNADKLKANARASFYYSIGHLYENNAQSVKAIEYYEKVVAAVPEYYVAQRGLGYLYAKQAEELRVSGSANYTAMARKALPHLEKAQACDPDNDTLDLIKFMYTHIHDTAALSTLNSRLKQLSKSCVDLLDDK